MCGSDYCISIAENPELAQAGGGLVFLLPGHKIYVVRTASGFNAVTAICTHANCTVEWNGSTAFECPCHGSRFTADGIVTNGPAFRPLRVYQHTLAGDVLTISLV
jgi:Rieske Fe-S protein